MADTKPFAEVRISRCQDGSEDVIGIDINGVEWSIGNEHSEEWLVEAAAFLSAAVAEREARLRGALEKLSRQVEMHYHPDFSRRFYPDHACGECVPGGEAVRDDFKCGRHEALAVLAGGGPDYVPVEKLRAAEAKVSGTWSILADLVHEGGLAGERAAQLMEALKLPPHRPPQPRDATPAEQ